MGTRYKPDTGKLNSLDDVDLALKEIGLAEKELDAIDAKLNAEIAKLKEKAVKDGEEKRKLITEKVAKIQAYAEYNKGDLFKENKSVELNFGKFGYRKSSKISVKKTTLELLKKLLESHVQELEAEKSEERKNLLTVLITKIQGCIRIKEEPNKEALALMDDGFLKSVGATRKITDDFFCEAATEDVNKDLLEKTAS